MISFFRKTPPQQELSAQEMYTIAVANAQRVIREEFSNPVLETVTMDRQVTTHQTVNDIVEEIHDSFYSEVEKLLAEAKITNSLETEYQSLIDKSERLRALGFTNTKEVKEAQAEIDRLNRLKNDNSEKAILIDAIEYFSAKYPNYKFITDESVTKICEKYGLVRGPIHKYIGTVPDKNLKHIEDFKLDKVDDCYTLYPFDNERLDANYSHYIVGYINGSEYESREKNVIHIWAGKYCITRPDDNDTLGLRDTLQIIKESLNIIAPVKDFDMKKSKLNGNMIVDKIEVPDPIVLNPVCYKNRKYSLVVTAWGLEASDELVVNPNHN